MGETASTHIDHLLILVEREQCRHPLNMCRTDRLTSVRGQDRELIDAWLGGIEHASILTQQNGMRIACDRQGSRDFSLPYVDDVNACRSGDVGQVGRSTIGTNSRREKQRGEEND